MLANTAKFYFEILEAETQFRVLEFRVHESVSALYEIDLTVAVELTDLDLDELMTRSGVLTILSNQSNNRIFHGEIVAATQLEPGTRFTRYQIKLVPKLWFLQHRSGCRIFQDLSVVDIVTNVLKGAGLTNKDYMWDIHGRFSRREYCVQYHESEFQFLSRLLEEEGIYFYFEHFLDRQVFVLTDQQSAKTSIAGNASVPFHEKTGMSPDETTIYQLSGWQQLVSSHVALSDYNFKKPLLSLAANSVGGEKDLSRAMYPGHFEVAGEGKQKANQQLLSLSAKKEIVQGMSDHEFLAAGLYFQLERHPNDALNKKYQILQVEIKGKQPQSLEEAAPQKGTEFSAEFYAIPHHVTFKPKCTYARPSIEGVQTAFVVGPPGEEIYTDQYGRIKVQFHWDREGQYDQDASCWLRVSHMLAGNKRGAMALPRVGQEVVVSFLNGDPSEPIVTGALYHEVNKPPQEMPVSKTQMGIKTQSYPGGVGFNEIRIDDKKSTEQLYLRAEKDYDTHIKHDLKIAIDHDAHVSITSSSMESVEGHSDLSVGSDQAAQFGGNISQSVGADGHYKIGGNQYVQAGKDIHQKASSNLAIQAGLSISLKGGSGAIKIDPSGVSITGPKVKINSGGSARSAKTASPSAPQKPTQVKPQ